MEFLILLFRIIYIVILGYTITSLVSIFLVALVRHVAPVHTSPWAFGFSVCTKLLEGVFGFYILAQGVCFFVIDLHEVLMSTWLKYMLGTLFTVIWLFHIELHKGREEGFMEIDHSNPILYRYDLYYYYLVRSILTLQMLGSLLLVFYLSFYPISLKAFLHSWYARLVFF